MADRNRVTQIGVETIGGGGPNRITQIGVETIGGGGPNRITQIGVEIITTYSSGPTKIIPETLGLLPFGRLY